MLNKLKENAGALGWRLTKEEITELESHPVNRKIPFFSRFLATWLTVCGYFYTNDFNNLLTIKQ